MLSDLSSDSAQFKSADTTQIIDQKHKLVTGFTLHPASVRVVVVEELEEHSIDKGGQSGGPHAMGAGFVVNAHAYFDLVVGNEFIGDFAAGDVHTFEGRAESYCIFGGELCNAVYFFQRGATAVSAHETFQLTAKSKHTQSRPKHLQSS